MTSLTARLSRLSDAELDLLEKRLEERRLPWPEEMPIRRRQRREYPLSYAQERLFFLHRLDPLSAAYNLFQGHRFAGLLDVPVLGRVLAEIVRRHAVLRSRFVARDGKPVQRVEPARGLVLPMVDLGRLPAAHRERQAWRLGGAFSRRPYDLAREAPRRFLLLRFSPADHVLFLCFHHLAADGWSYRVLRREIGALYRAFAHGVRSPLPEPVVQFGDFAHWQRRYLRGDRLEEQLAWWHRRLAGAPAVLDLPADRPRPSSAALASDRGALREIEIDSLLTAGLEAFAKRRGATLFVVLMAGFQVLLARYSGQRDLTVGIPVMGRSRPEVEDLIGLFVNTLVLRAELAGRPGFAALVRRVGKLLVEAQEHQDLPFERLVQDLSPDRSLAVTPLFQVLFAMQVGAESRPSASPPAPQQARRSGQTAPPRHETFGAEVRTTAFDLNLEARHEAGLLTFSLTYRVELFDLTTVARFLRHYRLLLEAAVGEPERPVWELPILAPVERQAILEGNDTARERPGDLLPRLFEQSAAAAPEALAVITDDDSLTYAELEERSARLAAELRRRGVGPGRLVGLAVERSVEMMVGVWGILRSGAAYVPFDPELPLARLELMTEEAFRDGPALVLTQSHLVERLPSGIEMLVLDAAWPRDSHPPMRTPGPDDLIYVIYTSGSTGRPKGAMNTHGALLNRLLFMQERFPLAPGDRVLQKTPLSFDVSAWELLWPHAVGATQVVARPGGHQDPDYLARRIAEERVTICHFVPSMLRIFLDAPRVARAAGLRYLVASGEALPVALAERVRRELGLGIHNLYGPTEAAIDVSVQAWGAAAARLHGARASVPIGRPIPNLTLHLFDRDGQVVPPGVTGELALGGVGLARGYLRRPALTAAVFVPDPAGNGARLYRTGDLARALPGGEIEFLGRRDHQVKVRGFRIELGEIEAALAGHEAIRQAVVVALRDGGAERLVAYALAEGQPPKVAELRDRLAARLPEYMVPAIFVFLDEFPLLPSGKVDRRALPAPSGTRETRQERPRVAPRNAAEESLAEIWSALLKLDEVGVEDSFFELGGDSILGLQMIFRAAEKGLRLTPRQLFERPTIAGLAVLAEHADAALEPRLAEQGAVVGEVPLLPVQRWFLEQRREAPHHFNQTLFLRVEPVPDAARLGRAIAALVEHHDALRLRLQGTDGGRPRLASPAAARDGVFARVDLAALPSARRGAARVAAARVQASLDLGRGPIVRAVLLTTTEPAARLLLVIHHLAVDGYSWRVLLEDLATLYDGGTLPAKTASVCAWGEHLEALAAAPESAVELDYWRDVAAASAEIPLDLPSATGDPLPREGTARTVGAALDRRLSAALLEEAHRAYGTRIEDILLAAMGRVLTAWTGGEETRVDLEGHGRDVLDDAALDPTRTVGWLTTIYPVRLRTGGELGEAIVSTKESLRAVPRRGVGYGLLRYLGPVEAREALAALPASRVLFNYLGQLDRGGPAEGPEGAGGPRFTFADESPGPAYAPAGRRSHLLEFVGRMRGGRLHLALTWSPECHRESTAQALVDAVIAELEALIEHCLVREERRFTPSDFPLTGLDQAALDRLDLGRRGVEDLYPLSPLQEGILFHSVYTPASRVYDLQLHCRIAGDFDPRSFHRAWQEVVDRHSILRSSFVWEDLERPLQAVHRRVEVPLYEEDWRALAPAEREARLERFLREDRDRGFDLGAAPLLRLALLRLADDVWQMVWTHHHLCLDGWSLPTLFQALFGHYRAAVAATSWAPPPARPYRDYIAWLAERDPAGAEEYWRGRLADFEEPTPLPAALPARAEASGDGRTTDGDPVKGRLEHILSPAAASALRELARRSGVTPSTVVQAAWALLLGRHAGRREVVFGATVSGRPADLAGAETMVGLFINTLPMRLELPAEAGLGEWLAMAQSEFAAARQFEWLSLARIQGWSAVAPGQSLFESLVVYENYPAGAALSAQTEKPAQGAAVPRFSITRVGHAEQTNYPLTLQALPGDDFDLRLGFDRGRLAPSAARRVLGHFVALLAAMTERPAARLGELSFLSPGERHQLLHEWNDTALLPLDGDAASMHHGFAVQAARVPERPAILHAGGTVSYAELAHRSTALAQLLWEHGVGPETRVGIFVERSPEMVVALLGILEASGCYLPLDVEAPRERLAFLLEDAGPRVVLSLRNLVERLPEVPGMTVLCLDGSSEPSSQKLRSSRVRPENSAYVIYTSGSTGRPKGVVISQRSASERIWATAADMADGDGFLQRASISFDASVAEIFAPLYVGGAIALPPAEAQRDFGLLARTMADTEVAQVSFTPQMLGVFLEHAPAPLWRAVRVLSVGGEEVPPDLPARVRRHVGRELTIYNRYGPTETAISVLAWKCPRRDPAAGERLPIGRPLPRAEVLILDRRLEPMPLGAVGELVIAGSYLARGYLDRPALTAEKFVPHPLAGRTANAGCCARLYRSGDLARLRHDGAVDFLGRLDRQVKIRGFRVELGEIEAVLARRPAVREVAVVLRRDPAGRRLVAYASPRPGEAFDAEDLRAAVAAELPGYMVPARFVLLESLPHTAGGKIDRRALPAPSEERDPGGLVAPRTPTEEILAQAWRRALRVERLGVFDNFFALGGDSISSLRVVALANRAGLRLTPKQVFEYQTIAELAAAVGTESTAVPDHGDALAARLSGVDREALDRRLTALLGAAAGAEDVVEDLYPLSPTQQGMLFFRLLEPASTAYFVDDAQTLAGELDPAAIEGAWRDAIAAHPILRTSFAWEGLEEPLQVVWRAAAWNETVPPWPKLDWRHKSADEQRRDLVALAAEDRRRGFDLGRPPLLRLVLVRLADELWHLRFSYHHILLDGWSIPLLRREIHARYLARLGLAVPELPARRPYRDFIAWIAGQDEARNAAFWRRELAGFKTPISLGLTPALSSPSPEEERFLGFPRRLEAKAAARLRRAAGNYRVTLNTLVQGAWALLLGRYAARRDVLFGATVSGRSAPVEGIDTMLGLAISTLPVRVRIAPRERLGEWLRALQARQAAAREFEHASLMRIQKWSEIEPPRMLLESLVVFENFPRDTSFSAEEAVEPGTITASPAPSAPTEETPSGARPVPAPRLVRRGLERGGHVSYPLTLVVDPLGEDLGLGLGVDARLFEESMGRRLADTLLVLLGGMAERQEARLDELPLLGAAEREHILGRWSAAQETPAAMGPQGGTVCEIVARRAAAAPSAPALIEPGEAGVRRTYAELERRSNRLAHWLRARGVGPETRVGLHLERSAALVEAIFGVWKAGGAYVPFDAATPPARLKALVEDCGAALVLSRSTLIPSGLARPDLAVSVIDLDLLESELEDLPATPPAGAPRPEHLAYLIYTSGSTGRPKAVMVEHRSLTEYCAAAARAIELGPDDRVLLFASPSFDTSAEEIFPALMSGAAVVPRDAAALEPTAFLDACRRARITVLDLPTVYWHELTRHLEEEPGATLPGGLRTVILGGEKAEPERLAAWYAALGTSAPELINTYGPTEATIVATWAPLPPPASPRRSAAGPLWALLPIGRPRPGARALVLGPALELLPPGAPGQLHLGGSGLARGYHRRPGRTAGVFVPDPFASAPGGRLYTTGDRARWREDGQLDFLGRLDRQVKLRGFRVELGEIEVALEALPALRQAVVVIRGSEEREEGFLCAYVVLENDGQDVVDNLRAELANRLPGHMIPAAFVGLPELPLLASGKVDRAALPEIAPQSAPATDVEAPRGELEGRLAALWEGVLGHRTIGRHDEFFALGGDSMIALRLMSRLRRELGRTVPLAVLFEHGTVAGLAEFLRGAAAAAGPAVALRSEGSRPPLFLVHPAGGEILCYRELTRALGAEQPVYGLQAPGLDSDAPPLERTEPMAELYLEALREVRRQRGDDGPWWIGGWSLGGAVACEMACRLEEAGEEVALVLLDTVAPEFLTGWSASELARNFALLIGRPGFDPRQTDEETLRRYRVYEGTVRAAETYRPRRFGGPALLVRAGDADGDGADLGWRRHLSRLEIAAVRGAIHQNLLEPPFAGRLAALLADWTSELNRAGAKKGER